MLNKKSYNTEIIKAISKDLNFISCGISKSGFLDSEANRFENWLRNNFHGKMSYMERNFDKRLDTTKLVEGSKSVISLLYNYFPNKNKTPKSLKISKYAYGKDYHFVIKEKLKNFVLKIKEQIGDVNGRVFVDSAPVLERAWAKKSGLGWIGKNTNLINKKVGSFFFLAEIIVDLELEYDNEVTDHCGSCTACIDACPTNAIYEAYKLDSNKCISYLTIELKDKISNEFKGQFDDWIFGCDICQDVCPWNKFSIKHNEPLFNPKSEIFDYSKKQWKELTNEVFNSVFKSSPVNRTKFEGLKRNIEFVQ